MAPFYQQEQEYERAAGDVQSSGESDFEDLQLGASDEEDAASYVISKPDRKNIPKTPSTKTPLKTPAETPTDTPIKKKHRKEKQTGLPFTPKHKSSSAEATLLTPRSVDGSSPAKFNQEGWENSGPKTPGKCIGSFGADARTIIRPHDGTPWSMVGKSRKNKKGPFWVVSSSGT